MDKFEQFFKENRLRLDTEDLDPNLIEKILGFMHHRKRGFWHYYAAASTIAIIVLATFLYYARTDVRQPVRQGGIFSEIATDLVQEEDTYLHTISKTENALRKMEVPVEYQPMFNAFTQQLQIIDEQYAIYKAQVEAHGYSEEIIQQIIYNYQLKLSVLQMLQSEVNKINHLSKNENHEYKKIPLSI